MYAAGYSKKAFLTQFSGFINTPPLWRDTTHFSIPQFLLKKGISPENIPQQEFPGQMVLGKRIERFFRIYLDHFTNEEVIAENVQIIANKVTLGEFDFILKNTSSGKLSHVEVVYKFYLYDPSFEEESHRWIGPNRKDSLSRKISRLRNRQLPLLYRKEAEPFLEELDITAEEVEQKVLFRANLFLPFSMLPKEIPLINDECIQGFWLRSSEFTEDIFGDFGFFSPGKPDWPVFPENGQEWYSFSEIKEQVQRFHSQQRSPLLWMKKNEHEYQRFFVVWW